MDINRAMAKHRFHVARSLLWKAKSYLKSDKTALLIWQSGWESVCRDRQSLQMTTFPHRNQRAKDGSENRFWRIPYVAVKSNGMPDHPSWSFLLFLGPYCQTAQTEANGKRWDCLWQFVHSGWLLNRKWQSKMRKKYETSEFPTYNESQATTCDYRPKVSC